MYSVEVVNAGQISITPCRAGPRQFCDLCKLQYLRPRYTSHSGHGNQ